MLLKKISSKNFLYGILLVAIFLFAAMTPFSPDEGMFPLSEIHKIDLKKAGLKISVDDVYNPDGVSLIDALVNVGGCTGSFISPEGLIITNHHCAFGAVQRASTTENNFLENGFLAKERNEEIKAQGVVCRITDSYEDVSEKILNAANSAEDVSERAEAISKEINKIEKEEEEKDPTITAVVSEMFTGQSYVLFRYKTIKDVRLVYVPPRAIGEFGGESDNWVWPRHTGDFSFMRAYVAPDGSSAPYSEENVPYHPKKYLNINANGVGEGDFIFILGYPGRTFKHQPSQFLIYQQEFQLPYISELYDWLINYYEEKGADNPEFALDISTTIKGLANVMKNYRGKLKGLDRLDLVRKKQEEEKQLQSFINNNPELKDKYGNLLDKIDEVYTEILDEGRLPLVLSQLSRQSTAYRLAELLIQYHNELDKPEADRRFKNKEDFLVATSHLYSGFDTEIDKDITSKILSDAVEFPELKNVEPFSHFSSGRNSVENFLNKIFNNSIVFTQEHFENLAGKSVKEINSLDDPWIDFVRKVQDVKQERQKRSELREGKLNILLAQLMDAKKRWLNKSFVPDANRTLRLTYGYIKGYSPADAVYYEPITTLTGVIEKGKKSGEYKLPEKIRELYKNKDFGMFKSDKLNDVPVALLYNTDTSGGNSGSPIMNAYGELIGVNFDRAYEATINDYTWSAKYSRSIGVDIRYVLWITQKVGGADFLLKEMGVL